MSEWSPDFEKKLVEAHRMKEPLPACPPPCHRPILAADGSAEGETTLKCTTCGASTTYGPRMPTERPGT
jgi:hypothetical protein